jgi:hypothetical protein
VSLPEEQIVRAVRHHVSTAEHPFFALVRLQAEPALVDAAWDVLRRGLRLADGDLVARGDRPGELVLYLHDISRRHARELLTRVFAADPRFEKVAVEVEHYPSDAALIDAWLESMQSAAVTPLAG